MPAAFDAPVPIEVIDRHRLAVGECPLWDHRDRSLWWIDVRGPHLHRLEMNGARQSWTLAAQVGAIALARLPNGGAGLLVAGHGGFGWFDPASGVHTPIVDPEADRPKLRLNDGRVDARGRMWSGSLQPGVFTPQGRVWNLDDTGTVRCALEGLAIPNGIAFSPDARRLYVADSAQCRIDVCDLDLDEGRVANRRPFVQLPVGRGLPDGATVDVDGCLWSAHFNGWCITRYTPAGEVDRVVNLPVRCVTSCAFGGADFGTLYITSGAVHTTESERDQQPLAGWLLAVRVGVQGMPEREFRLGAQRQ